MTIEVEYLNYGKLVLSKDGAVPHGAGYGVTRRSRGIDREAAIDFTPYRMLQGVSLSPELIDPASRKRGFLVICPVRVTNEARREDRYVGIMRGRYRSEAGEHLDGRLYLQAHTWAVPWATWTTQAGAVLEACVTDLAAEPDLVSEPTEDRFNGAPLRITERIRDLPSRPNIEEESRNAARSLQKLLSSGDRVGRFGRESFHDEATFVRSVGVALDLMSGSDGSNTSARLVTFTSGLSLSAWRSTSWVAFEPSVEMERKPALAAAASVEGEFEASDIVRNLERDRTVRPPLRDPVHNTPQQAAFYREAALAGPLPVNRSQKQRRSDAELFQDNVEAYYQNRDRPDGAVRRRDAAIQILHMAIDFFDPDGPAGRPTLAELRKLVDDEAYDVLKAFEGWLDQVPNFDRETIRTILRDAGVDPTGRRV